MFNFHRLDVYRCAISLLSFAAPLADRAPRGFSSLSDQLRRASLSIPLNIAEGSGKYEKDERRYFNLARRSALECAAIMDVFEALSAATSTELAAPRELLERIVSMLTRLSQS